MIIGDTVIVTALDKRYDNIFGKCFKVVRIYYGYVTLDNRRVVHVDGVVVATDLIKALV